MKICWDNLEKLRYSKRSGKWYKKSATYVYVDSCKTCKEPFLAFANTDGIFCSPKCNPQSGKKNPMYGKTHTPEAKRKMSESRRGKNHYFYGKKHSDETKKKISKSRKNKLLKDNNPSWNGGYYAKNIPVYDIYAHQIKFAEQVRRNKDDENTLEVKCAYCGKWYIPSKNSIRSRINVLNGKNKGENKLYCSNGCKDQCPIFNKQKYPKGHKIATSREVQPELRQMVFERDNYTCQECGSTKSLHCHHIEGIRYEPIESADIDKCITYCKKCHKEVHKKEGCGYHEMKCEAA